MIDMEPTSEPTPDAPSLETIQETHQRLGDLIRHTPVWQWHGFDSKRMSGDAQIFLKLELFQYAGSFKTRGALSVMLGLEPALLRCGVTTVSAGNHAMAVTHAARSLHTTAKVVMPKSADAFRVDACRQQGADVILVDDVHTAFETAKRIETEEGRFFVHPFEGWGTVCGTATLGLEFGQQVPELDAVLVPIGGGGPVRRSGPRHQTDPTPLRRHRCGANRRRFDASKFCRRLTARHRFGPNHRRQPGCSVRRPVYVPDLPRPRR